MPAALLVLAPLRRASALLVPLAACGLLATSLFYYYSEDSEQPFIARQQVERGFFAGLSVSATDRAFLDATQKVASLVGTGRVVVVGSSPGLILQTRARAAMPSPAAFSPWPAGEAGLKATRDYYAAPEHLAEWAVVYSDAFVKPNDDFVRDHQYRLVDRFPAGDGIMSVFRRGD
jgi:hypothetical protein